MITLASRVVDAGGLPYTHALSPPPPTHAALCWSESFFLFFSFLFFSPVEGNEGTNERTNERRNEGRRDCLRRCPIEETGKERDDVGGKVSFLFRRGKGSARERNIESSGLEIGIERPLAVFRLSYFVSFRRKKKLC
jgi:hypothetical protein